MVNRTLDELMSDIFDNAVLNLEKEYSFCIDTYFNECDNHAKAAQETGVNIGTPYADKNRKCVAIYERILYKSYNYVLNSYKFDYLVELLEITLDEYKQSNIDDLWESSSVQTFIKDVVVDCLQKPKEYEKLSSYIENAKAEFWSQSFFQQMVIDVFKSSDVKVGKRGKPPISDKSALDQYRLWQAVNLIMIEHGISITKAYEHAQDNYGFSDVAHKYPKIDKMPYAQGAWRIELRSIQKKPLDKWPEWYRRKNKNLPD